MIYHGDLFDVLPTLPAESIDACVCDPPYLLGFMNKAWDRSGVSYRLETWREIFRVLKPGAHLLAFGGTRTYHRMVCAIEDAGFEIRDSISFLFGTGFPKSTRINRDPAFCQCGEPARNAACRGHAQSQADHTDTAAVSFDGAPLFSGVLHSTDRAPDSQGGYRLADDSGDARLHQGAGADRVPAPLSGDVRGRIRSGERADDQDCVQGRSPSQAQCTDRLSSLDSARHDYSANATGARTPESTLPVDTCEFPSRTSDKNHSVSREYYGTGLPRCHVCAKPIADGLGTALKPGHELIVLARKPFKGSVTANVQRHGTGALNIDACRIASDDDTGRPGTISRGGILNVQPGCVRQSEPHDLGRWPANVVIDDLAALVIDEQSGESVSAGGRIGNAGGGSVQIVPTGQFEAGDPGYGDVGGASRFFYCAKPSREERDLGCDDLPPRITTETVDRDPNSAGVQNPRAGAGRGAGTPIYECARCGLNLQVGRGATRCDDGSEHERIIVGYGVPVRNSHPTVKPLALMRWLVRLVTPPGGTVIDPFLGSGTTGMACVLEQREFIGVEREADYIEIAKRRMAATAPLFSDATVLRIPKSAVESEASQRTLFEAPE